MAVYNGTPADDTYNGTTGADTIIGLDGDDMLDGQAGNDLLDGGNGFDFLTGGAGNDTLIGGDGWDYASYWNATAAVNVNLNIGRATGGAGTDSLSGIEAVFGSKYNDILVGDANNNFFNGYLGNDSISGGAGDDTFIGGGGKDTIDGGDGNDSLILEGSLGEYVMSRGTGADVKFTRGTEVIVARNVESFQFGYGGPGTTELTLSEVLARIGSAKADTLIGSSVGDYLDGLAGNDQIIGGDGNDTLIGGVGNDTLLGGVGDDTYEVDAAGDVVLEAADEGIDLVNVKLTSGSYTLGANLENATVTSTGAVKLIGNELANVLTGNAAVNTLDGGAGDDILVGNAGNDVLIGGAGNDTMYGGTGNDTYEVDSLDDIVVEEAKGGTDTVHVNITTNGTLYALDANVENATMTSTAALGLVGNELANVLTGNAAANLLDGGKGADRLIGGAGSDTYVVDVAGDVIVEAATSGEMDIAMVAFENKGTYTLAANVEVGVIVSNPALLVNLTGNASNNSLYGNVGSNLLMGGAGNDTLYGGGYDSMFGVASDTLDGGAGTGDVAGFDGNFSNYVVARTSSTDVRLTNLLTGNVTTVRNVEYFDFNDSVIALADLKANTASISADKLNGTANADWIDGLAGNDTIDGKAGNDTLRGDVGNDTLIGGEGVDSMLGGAGNDTYEVDSVDDVVVELANGGTDQVNVSMLYPWGDYVLAENVESGVLNAGSIATLVGNAGNNTLSGNAGNNRLKGEGGNDTLMGYAGNDTLSGGAGTNRLIGGTGDDWYMVNSTSDVIVELANEGDNDTLAVDSFAAVGTYVLGANVEHGTVSPRSSTAINLTGNGLANSLTGNAGGNVLIGGAGNDTLTGAGGFDTLTGGAGADVFAFDTAPSNVTNVDYILDFNASQGDKIQLSASVFSSLGVAGDTVDLMSEYLYYDRLMGVLSYDADGSGSGYAETIAFVGIDTHPTLTSADFILV